MGDSQLVGSEIRPQPGPQTAFLESPADIAIYGGAAGGGKSYALLLEGVRHSGVPNYGGVIFRRTSPELQGAGSLWDEAQRLYRGTGASMRESPTMLVRWPSGAQLQMLHLQHESDVYAHQGKQYAFVGFDELTHFTETQFWYLVSRLRSPSSVRPYLRGTCNPDPDSFVRKLIAWWIGPDGYAIPERSGVLRWFVRDGDAMVWADTREELAGRGVEPMSLTFIAASLDDNPALLARDPAYRARLQSLPQVERERLLGGNWDVRAMGGDYIRAEWLARRWSSRAALPPLSIYIASDYAVTAPTSGRDPDWTEHGVFGVAPDDTLYVVDWWRGRTTPDVWIDKLLDLIERHKPITVFGEGGTIRRSIEPFLIKRMRERRIYARLEWLSSSTGHGGGARTLQGYEDASKRAKAIRGRALQARAAMGKLCMPEDQIAEWVPHVVSQLVAFPTGHDDAFDSASLMCLAIDQAHPALAPTAAKPEPPRDYGHGERRSRRASDWRTV